MFSNWRGVCGVLALSASVALLGCGDSPVAYVRTVNVANGLSNYTLQIGTQGVASSVPYGTVGVQPKGDNYSVNDNSGSYRAIPAGTDQKVIVYGSAPSNVLYSGTQSFTAKTSYTVVTLGANTAPGVITLTDGGTAPSSGDMALRLYDASGVAGAVDVYVTGQGAPIGGSPVASNLQIGQVTKYINVPAGAVEFQVTPTGNPSKVLFTGQVTTTGGNLYTGYFFDPPIGNPAKGFGLLLTPDPTIASTSSGS